MKQLTMVLVMATMLAGCGAAPNAATGEQETVVRTTRTRSVTAKKTPAPILPAGFVAGPGSSLAHTPAPLATPTPPVPVAAAAAYVSIVAEPDTALRVFPVRAGEGVLLDALFAPESGELSWTLQAPAAGVSVSKVKVVVDGASTPFTVEAKPAAFGLPDTLQGRVVLSVPFSLVATYQALAADPNQTRLAAIVTFYGADDAAINGPEGRPLALAVTIDVQ